MNRLHAQCIVWCASPCGTNAAATGAKQGVVLPVLQQGHILHLHHKRWHDDGCHIAANASHTLSEMTALMIEVAAFCEGLQEGQYKPSGHCSIVRSIHIAKASNRDGH
jgi:hypothetical protein